MSEDKNLKIKKRFFYEGAQLALFLAESNGLGEYGEIADFYGTLIKNAFEWFESKKYPEIVEEYRSCDDSHKKYGGVVKYGYFIKVFVNEENGKNLTVSCEVCLKNGRGEKIFEFLDIETWDKELQIMAKKRKRRKAK